MRDLFQGVGREATGYLLLSGSDGASRGYYAHGHAHREVFGLEREYAASEEPSADQAEAAEEKSAAARRSQSEKATRGAT
jgi:hypothetical protein